MRFGKIDYLNLLPFEVFIRRYPMPPQFRLFYKKRKSYPAKLNKEFLFSRIDGGFISSIMASKKGNFLALKAGIIARKKVMSVVCFTNERGEDYQSATSNALLKVLDLKGRVLIGDKALKEVLHREKKDYIDLAEFWVKKEHLPFVFGRLCVRKNKEFYEKMVRSFVKKPIKIPYFIIEKYAKSSEIDKQDILEYLQYISYKIDKKASLGVERFYRKLRLAHISAPKRF